MTPPDVKKDEPKVYRCACGWSGLLEHLADGKNCQNCGKQLAGDNEAADAAAAAAVEDPLPPTRRRSVQAAE